MMTSILGLVDVLLLPLLTAAGGWIIAVKALAEKDEISKLVEALTQPNGVEESASSDHTYLRRRRLSAVASSNRRRFLTRLRHNGRTAIIVLRANSRTFKQTFFREHNWQGDRATAQRARRDRELSQFVSRVKARHLSRLAIVALLATGLISASSPPANAGRFAFDQRRSEVRFIYKMGYSTQRGRFTKVSGTINYDENAPEKSKISASIASASLTTGEALVDEELKGPAFFNVAASPVIAFRSLKVSPLSAATAEVSGEITVNGITKPVKLNVSLKPHDDPALKYDVGAREFVATTRIQRSAFNMTDYQSMVADDIDIEIAAIIRPR